MKPIILLALLAASAFGQTKLCIADASDKCTAQSITMPATALAALRAFATVSSTPVLDEKGVPTGAITGKYVDEKGTARALYVIADNIEAVVSAVLLDPRVVALIGSATPSNAVVQAKAALVSAQAALDAAIAGQKNTTKQ